MTHKSMWGRKGNNRSALPPKDEDCVRPLSAQELAHAPLWGIAFNPPFIV